LKTRFAEDYDEPDEQNRPDRLKELDRPKERSNNQNGQDSGDALPVLYTTVN